MNKQILTTKQLIKDQHQGIQIIIAIIFIICGVAGICALALAANKLIVYNGVAPIIMLGIFASLFALIGVLLFNHAISSVKAIKSGQFYIFEDTVIEKKMEEVYMGSRNGCQKHRWEGKYTFEKYDKLIERDIEAENYNETQIGDEFYLLKLYKEKYVVHIYPKSKYDLDHYLSTKITSATVACKQEI